jgi:hypothetical protein
MSAKWVYLTVEVANKGRTIFENGILAKSHTKNVDLTPLNKSLWNSNGKEMMHEAKGAVINHYGDIGWELVATKFGEDFENTYIFKKNN